MGLKSGLVTLGLHIGDSIKNSSNNEAIGIAFSTMVRISTGPEYKARNFPSDFGNRLYMSVSIGHRIA